MNTNHSAKNKKSTQFGAQQLKAYMATICANRD